MPVSFQRVLLGSLLVQQSFAGKREEAENLKCQVCNLAAKNAHEWVKEKKTTDPDDIEDMLTFICTTKRPEGWWVASLDLSHTEDGNLEATQMEGVGKCNRECDVSRLACERAMYRQNDRFKEMLVEGADVEKMQKKLCKKVCEAERPQIDEWTNEVFDPVNMTLLRGDWKYQEEVTDGWRKGQWHSWDKDQSKMMSDALDKGNRADIEAIAGSSPMARSVLEMLAKEKGKAHLIPRNPIEHKQSEYSREEMDDQMKSREYMEKKNRELREQHKAKNDAERAKEKADKKKAKQAAKKSTEL